MVCGARAIPGSRICGKQACRTAREKRGRKLGRPHRRAAEAAMAGAYVCWFCGEAEDADDPFERHHIVSREEGGTNDPDNYAPAHRSCNRAGRARTKEEV